MGMFDDAPFEAGRGPSGGTRPPLRPRTSGLFDDAPMEGAAPAAVPDAPGRAESVTSIAADVAQSAGAGLIRGAAGLVDLPQTIVGLADTGARMAAEGVVHAFGGKTRADRGLNTRMSGLFPLPSDLPKPGESAIHALESATGPLYRPATKAGEFARTAAEFVPGVGRGIGNVVAYGVIPGLASEGAGQVTKGSALETPARIVAGVGVGLGAAAFRAPGNAEAAVAGRMKGVEPQQVDQAEALFREATERGLPLTRANALDAVTGGVTSLSDLQRVMEGNGRLKGFFAPTAGAVEREGRAALDTVGAASPSPAALGGEIQAAARAGVEQTPQGMALADARAAGGPRVTPEQAGHVIQPELRRVYEGREGMRAALGEQDYAAARNAPETVGIERTVTVERPGEPIITRPEYGRPQFDGSAPQPLPAGPAAAPATAQPQSLIGFLAKEGGVPLDAEARAADLNRFYVPGGGTLARKNAPSWDDLRVKLTEAGFLPPDAAGYARAEGVRDFVLDAIHQERIGRGRTVRMADQGVEGARRGRMGDEYDAALSGVSARLDEGLTAAGVSPSSVHPDIRSRALNELMGDPRLDPLDAYERVVGAVRENPRPYSRSTTVTEEIPDVRFGQANPQAVVSHIDRALESAKGPVAKALASARETLFTRATEGRQREIDLSVAGLHGAREAINDLIAKAEPTAQRALMGVRERLDEALGSVPEYEHARSGFEAASRALDPFSASAAPGRIVARDQVSGRQTMTPERVPGAIDEGSSGARAFNEVATPAARTAYEGHLRTRFLDAATDAATGEVSVGKIRELLRANEDGLRQFPAVREHLESVAFARAGRDVVDRSPLGRMASNPVAQNAIEALFPTGAKGTSAVEVGEAVRRLAANNPRAATELVRMHMEQVFDQATTRLQTGANQAGGAKFSKMLVGHSKEAASMEAAVRALPGGEATWGGVRRLLDIFDAQGTRQVVGSGTSFNNTIMGDLAKGKPIGEAGAAIATGGLKLPGRIMDKIEGWRMGRGLDEMARLFTDPKMASTFRRLATEPQGSRGLIQLAVLAVDRAARGYGAADGAKPTAGPVREPLKLTLRPRP